MNEEREQAGATTEQRSAWALKLSSLVSFISETVLLGFKAGAALAIAMTQLPKLLAVPGGGNISSKEPGY